MIELATLLLLITLSMLIVRAGTIALQKTGLSREIAGFQDQSAFMRVGFTTSEAEMSSATRYVGGSCAS